MCTLSDAYIDVIHTSKEINKILLHICIKLILSIAKYTPKLNQNKDSITDFESNNLDKKE